MKGPQTWIHRVSNPGPSGLKSSVLPLDQAHRARPPKQAWALSGGFCHFFSPEFELNILGSSRWGWMGITCSCSCRHTCRHTLCYFPFGLIGSDGASRIQHSTIVRMRSKFLQSIFCVIHWLLLNYPRCKDSPLTHGDCGRKLCLKLAYRLNSQGSLDG